jgi:hypothetical protein
MQPKKGGMLNDVIKGFKKGLAQASRFMHFLSDLAFHNSLAPRAAQFSNKKRAESRSPVSSI